ncbi:protein kinase [Streptomyces antibioticus]|uniref:Serine/threonine protein kinase n=1 Tax=Streptomyces antibioticus TaxID=1890 RepID=A0ABX3LGN9_STRAT|nr:protein kinase [Streptomyces antibioticus]OOQ49713.1 serine/threonine protein kinase [Streptomyces antibioticus]
MDDYAGRVLADRYRLPLPPSDEYELTETRAFDTYSGQEVLVRQVPLPEVVEAEVLDAEGLPAGFTARERTAGRPGARPGAGGGPRRPADPVVRRAVEAAQAAASIPDHPRLDQVFDVFAEGGSLWIVSESVAARPLAALLAEKPLTPYRAAEVASDVLMALRVLHAHGWVHRNITARTVMVCDDGRVMLTGLAVGAAEEALCGYDPVPVEDDDPPGNGVSAPPNPAGPPAAGAADPEAARRAAIEARAAGALPPPGGEQPGGPSAAVARRAAVDSGEDIRAARAGAIAAYRAGARAAARVQEAQNGRAALPGARTPLDDGQGTAANGAAVNGAATGTSSPFGTPPGQIVDPYGVRGAPGRSGHALPHAPTPNVSASTEAPSGTRWDDLVAAGAAGAAAGVAPGATAQQVPTPVPAPRRGPATALAAERARQARMAVVGPVTERWAPEQAGPVHENWQLAAPIGPATDLWALGALLFRAVQGHAPYPEESTAELVQMVCAEPPAYAEECGSLRPVVESLLRQDPTERLDFEELRGWLRSLVRSAPEPEAGAHVVAAPPADPSRLPIVRRKGELVRRRRAARLPAPGPRARHKRARPDTGRAPRSLGRTLLLLILLALAAAFAYALLFMPKAGEDGASGTDATQRAGATAPPAGQAPEASSEPRPDQTAPGSGNGASASSGTTQDGTETEGGSDAADGFTVREDEAGFRIAVADGWDRTPKNGRGQIVYTHGDFELIVVPGRDSASANGTDPMVYQREKESELQPYRDSSWATASGLRTTTVGERVMAEGQFTWNDGGRERYVRNLAILLDGRYHVVQVRGPEAERDEVTRLYEQAADSYEYTG